MRIVGNKANITNFAWSWKTRITALHYSSAHFKNNDSAIASNGIIFEKLQPIGV